MEGDNDSESTTTHQKAETSAQRCPYGMARNDASAAGGASDLGREAGRDLPVGGYGGLRVLPSRKYQPTVAAHNGGTMILPLDELQEASDFGAGYCSACDAPTRSYGETGATGWGCPDCGAEDTVCGIVAAALRGLLVVSEVRQ